MNKIQFAAHKTDADCVQVSKMAEEKRMRLNNEKFKGVFFIKLKG